MSATETTTTAVDFTFMTTDELVTEVNRVIESVGLPAARQLAALVAKVPPSRILAVCESLETLTNPDHVSPRVSVESGEDRLNGRTFIDGLFLRGKATAKSATRTAERLQLSLS